jgi:hypothetical protein
MPVLSTSLRNDLSRVITKARQVAEAGTRKALESLAVARYEPHDSMSPDERKLRNRLRARSRQLGDVRDKQSGNQSIDRLTHEVAYEHWHRMLFARFLAENGLLVHPDHGIAVSLEEIEELARETGDDPRSMVARFAQDCLPQIFRSGDPVLEVSLAPEVRQALDKLLDSLPAAVFTADDSLGWTYQYWQTEKKSEANESGKKIGPDELPAVTQLFTEHYMVLFLYHNTIGAWHAGKVLAENPTLSETAQSEEELRQAVSLRSQGGYDFKYLRFLREPTKGDEADNPVGPWRPAAGIFEGWPKTAKELRVLDPCCGSGHFLTEGFELLVRLTMDEEGFCLEDAVRSVLANNLHGLELEPRCTQIAAFNLAIAAWKLVGKPIELPAMHIACSGLALGSSRTEWTKLAGDDQRLRVGMERLYDLFERAPDLGSLIDPRALKSDLLAAEFAELQPLLEQALARETDDVEITERTVAARGMARAAELLSDQFTLVATNPPYLTLSKQAEGLAEMTSEYFMLGKRDLATVFLRRIERFLSTGGVHATVTPQNWLYLGAYKRLREHLLTRQTSRHVTRIGSGATSTASWDVLRALLISENHILAENYGVTGLEAEATTEAGRAEQLLALPILSSTKNEQLANPDHRFALNTNSRGIEALLAERAISHHGLTTGDTKRMVFKFWEVSSFGDLWIGVQGTVATTTLFAGSESILRWANGTGAISELPGARKDGVPAWGRGGVLVTQMRQLPVTTYLGQAYDNNTAVLQPKNPSDLPALWCFCSSPQYSKLVRTIDQKLGVTSATLAKVPFDLAHWQKVAAERHPNGLSEPQSHDPTQWIFHGHPAKAEPATVLQVAVSRLLGYRWPPELDPEMFLANDAREWVTRCDELVGDVDEDGIVCLAASRGEGVAVDRLRNLLSAAFGPGWSAAKERELLAASAGDGNTPVASLDIWLRDKFFEEHCKLFHHRPFVWHIWDGNKDGFHCLVNAHKLTGPDGEGRRTLEAITYSYLGDWIDRQKADQREGKEGSDACLAAAKDLQSQLENILEGSPPYDLFVRWKPLDEQAVGWEPDINDGVRLNIRPFMNAVLRVGGRTGAGILRWKPSIKWKKDRGKEPQNLRPKADFPWFWGCAGDDGEADRTDFSAATDFDGNRWNDLHYTRAIKEASRSAATVTEDKEMQA